MKKVFAWIILIGIFVSFLVSVGLVVAEEGGTTVGEFFLGKLGEGINSSSFNGIFNKDSIFAMSTTKFLLGVLLWMVLYSVFKQAGIFKGQGGLWSGAAAVIVTILFFMYLPSDFAIALVFPYAATGATILHFIPILIIFYFTFMVSESDALSLGILYTFLIYYFFILVFVSTAPITVSETSTTGEVVKEIFGGSRLLNWAIFGLYFLQIIFFSKFRYKLSEMKIQQIGRQSGETVDVATDLLNTLKRGAGKLARGKKRQGTFEAGEGI